MGYYIFLIALTAALGGFVYGVDSGTVSATIGHESFLVYMLGPTGQNAPLLGAIVALYNGGQAIGTVVSGYSADKLSRRWTICGGALTSVCGDILQASSQNPSMMIAGRLLSGTACGIILSIVPVYMAEVSPPKQRGLVVGLQGMMISIGYMLANWVGYFSTMAPGDFQWRIPLAVQILPPMLLFFGCFFIPYSPLWLIEQHRYDEAKIVLLALHKTQNENLLKEFTQIRNQIELERHSGHSNWLRAIRQLFSPKYIRRTATASFIVMMVQLSGSNVIQNYQSIFYGMVGYTGQQALLIGGAYGTIGVLGQVIYLTIVADWWPRPRTLWVGSMILVTAITACSVLTSLYQGGPAGLKSQLAVACIFIFSCSYAIFCNSMVWVVPSELFPFFLRSKGLGVAVFSRAICAILVSQITPLAIQTISWRYYIVFIATNFSAAVLYFFFLPETRGKSLEEVAEIFGDQLAIHPSGDSLDSLEKPRLHARHLDVENEAGLLVRGPMPRWGRSNVDFRGSYNKGGPQRWRHSEKGIIERMPSNRKVKGILTNRTVENTSNNYATENEWAHAMERMRTNPISEDDAADGAIERMRARAAVEEWRSASRNTERRPITLTIDRKYSPSIIQWRPWTRTPERRYTYRPGDRRYVDHTLESEPIQENSLQSATTVSHTKDWPTMDYQGLSYQNPEFAGRPTDWTTGTGPINYTLENEPVQEDFPQSADNWPTVEYADRSSPNNEFARRPITVTIDRKYSPRIIQWRPWGPRTQGKVTYRATARRPLYRTFETGLAQGDFLGSAITVPYTEEWPTDEYAGLTYPTLGFARGMDGQTFFLS